MAVNYIKPEVGQVYALRSGAKYQCSLVMDADKVMEGRCYAIMIREDGWETEAHGIWQNEDGTIEWNYSSGGHWPMEIEVIRVVRCMHCVYGRRGTGWFQCDKHGARMRGTDFCSYGIRREEA